LEQIDEIADLLKLKYDANWLGWTAKSSHFFEFLFFSPLTFSSETTTRGQQCVVLYVVK
jgi:hypothetical protein